MSDIPPAGIGGFPNMKAGGGTGGLKRSSKPEKTIVPRLAFTNDSIYQVFARPIGYSSLLLEGTQAFIRLKAKSRRSYHSENTMKEELPLSQSAKRCKAIAYLV